METMICLYCETNAFLLAMTLTCNEERIDHARIAYHGIDEMERLEKRDGVSS